MTTNHTDRTALDSYIDGSLVINELVDILLVDNNVDELLTIVVEALDITTCELIEARLTELNVTAHINTVENVKIDAVTSQSITHSVRLEEQLSIDRAMLLEPTAEQVKAVNEQRKANLSALATIFKTRCTIDTVTSLCNELLAPLNGGDDAARKRAQKRRAFFGKVVAESYPSYDMETTKGRNGGVVSFKKVGDEHTRKATSVVEVYRDIRTFMPDLPEISTKELAQLFRSGAPKLESVLDDSASTEGLTVGVATGTNQVDMLQGMADKIKALQDNIAEKQANA